MREGRDLSNVRLLWGLEGLPVSVQQQILPNMQLADRQKEDGDAEVMDAAYRTAEAPRIDDAELHSDVASDNTVLSRLHSKTAEKQGLEVSAWRLLQHRNNKRGEGLAPPRSHAD